MKITKQKLIKIIKEELDAALAESAADADEGLADTEWVMKRGQGPMPMEHLTDTEWEFWKSTFNEAVDAQRSEGLDVDVEEASNHANAEVVALRNAETSDPLPTNPDDGIDF